VANWNDVASNRIVVNSTLQSGVNVGAFSAKTAIPADELGATKTRADQYVNIATHNPTYSAKASNQLVAKRDLTGVVNLALTLQSLDGDGADNQVGATDIFGLNYVNFFGNTTENRTLAAGTVSATSYTIQDAQYSWTAIPSNSLRRRFTITDLTADSVIYDQFSSVGDSSAMNTTFTGTPGRSYSLTSRIDWTSTTVCWFTNITSGTVTVQTINTDGNPSSVTVGAGGSFQAYALRSNYSDFCFYCGTVYPHALTTGVDCQAACSADRSSPPTYYSPDQFLTSASLLYTNQGLCGGNLTQGVYSDGDNCYEIVDTIQTNISWNLVQNTDVSGCQDGGWVVSNSGMSVRYNIANSLNCGGSCNITQTGTATATINVGSQNLNMALSFEGIAERQATNFENIRFFLNNVEVARATSPGGNLGCQFGPAVSTFLVASPYPLNANTQYTLRIEFTTGDALYHVGCFYDADLIFTPR
jgi:hypothetical protein